MKRKLLLDRAYDAAYAEGIYAVLPKGRADFIRGYLAGFNAGVRSKPKTRTKRKERK